MAAREVASLSGREWLGFLDGTPGGEGFLSAPGDQIEDIALCRVSLSSEDENDCETWRRNGSGVTVYALRFPWLLAALPLPLLVYWLMPPYREEQDSLRLTFFHYITASLGLRPQPGAVIPKSNWLQKIVAPICWALMVLALGVLSLLSRRFRRSSRGGT